MHSLESDHKSSILLHFYKHIHIYIFIKQIYLSSDVKNVLVLWPNIYHYFLSRLLSHMVSSPLIMHFFSCIYPTSPLGFSQSPILLLLWRKTKQNKKQKSKLSSTLHHFLATILTHDSQDLHVWCALVISTSLLLLHFIHSYFWCHNSVKIAL